MCRRAKEQWMTVQCGEIEQMERNHKHCSMHRKIKSITNMRKGWSSAGGIEERDGTISYEKGNIKRRWREYLEELFQDITDEPAEPEEEEHQPHFSMSEIEAAIKLLPNGKACGEDGIVAEMLKPLGESGKKKLLDILNRIYKSGEFPDDFIAIPKKAKSEEMFRSSHDQLNGTRD